MRVDFSQIADHQVLLTKFWRFHLHLVHQSVIYLFFTFLWCCKLYFRGHSCLLFVRALLLLNKRIRHKFNVWCGLMRDKVVGLFLLGHATRVRFPTVKHWHCWDIEMGKGPVYFQQDGAWSATTLQFVCVKALEIRIGGRWWTGREGPTPGAQIWLF